MQLLYICDLLGWTEARQQGRLNKLATKGSSLNVEYNYCTFVIYWDERELDNKQDSTS